MPHTFTVRALRHTKHSHSFTLPYTHTTTSHSHHTNMTPQHHHHHHPYNTPIHPPRYPTTTTTTTCAIHAPPPPHTHRTYHHHHHLRTPITHRTINQSTTHSLTPTNPFSNSHTPYLLPASFPHPYTHTSTKTRGTLTTIDRPLRCMYATHPPIASIHPPTLIYLCFAEHTMHCGMQLRTRVEIVALLRTRGTLASSIGLG